MRKIDCVLVGFVALTCGACADAVGPKLVPAPVGHTVNATDPDGDTPIGDGSGSGGSTSGGGTATDCGGLPCSDFDPAFSRPATILEFDVDAGFLDRDAYGNTYMKYFGNEAKVTVQLTVHGKSGSIETPLLTKTESSLLPWVRELRIASQVRVRESCGSIAHATGTGAAMHRALLPSMQYHEWEKNGDSRNRSGEQPPCTTEAPGGGEKPTGGEDGAGQICETIVTEHYWYYLETGEVEYRFTTSSVHCRSSY